MKEEQKDILGHLMWVSAKVAKDDGLDEKGYWLVINNGKFGGKFIDWELRRYLG